MDRLRGTAKSHNYGAYLGVAPLVREVASVYQDIALWQLDSGIMGVADAHDPGLACETRSQ